MDPVVHFEMPYEDGKRMADFYTKAFGWQTKQMGEEMGSYVTVTTAESNPNDLAGRPKEPGTINGGFFKKSPENSLPSVVIAVKDIQASMQKVTAAGGKILTGNTGGQPVNIPGVGLYIGIQDTEGNRISLLQPMGM